MPVLQLLLCLLRVPELLLLPVQRVIFGQHVLLDDSVFPAFDGLRLSLLFLFARLPQSALSGLCLLQHPGQAFQVLLLFFYLFRGIDAPLQFPLLFFQGFFLPAGFLQGLFIHFQQGPDQDQDLLRGLFAGQDLLPPEGLHLPAAGGVNGLNVRPAALAELFQLFEGLGRLRPESVLQLLVVFGMKNIAEDPLAGLGVGQQELEEVALGNHGDLGKLVLVDPQQVRDIGGDLAVAGLHIPVRADQPDTGGLESHSGPPFRGPLIGGIASDLIFFSV